MKEWELKIAEEGVQRLRNRTNPIKIFLAVILSILFGWKMAAWLEAANTIALILA